MAPSMPSSVDYGYGSTVYYYGEKCVIYMPLNRSAVRSAVSPVMSNGHEPFVNLAEYNAFHDFIAKGEEPEDDSWVIYRKDVENSSALYREHDNRIPVKDLDFQERRRLTNQSLIDRFIRASTQCQES